MSTGAECIIAAIGGAAAGATATVLAMRKHYQDDEQKRVEEIRKLYAEKAEARGDVEKAEKIRQTADKDAAHTNREKTKYKDILKRKGYVNYSGDNPGEVVEKNVKPQKDWVKPYVITPDEYRELEDDGTGWDTRTLYYFADKVLTDSDYEKIEDIESTVGEESLTHFGEYEDDSVYVRNENRKIDYEILIDDRTWSNVKAKKPKPSRMEG